VVVAATFRHQFEQPPSLIEQVTHTPDLQALSVPQAVPSGRDVPVSWQILMPVVQLMVPV